MTSTARFDNWQNRLGTQAGSIDASGNVTFDNDVTVTGGATVSGDLAVTGNVTSANQGLVLIDTYNIPSSVFWVDMLNVFSADFDAYRVILSGNVTASGGNPGEVYVLLGNGGTISTAPNYRWTSILSDYPSFAFGNNLLVISGTNQVGGVLMGLVSASGYGDASVAMFDIHNPYVTRETTFNGFGADSYAYYWHGGQHTDVSSYTDMRISASGPNTLSGGQINVYGYKLG
jgi:hypothetical protein